MAQLSKGLHAQSFLLHCTCELEEEEMGPTTKFFISSLSSPLSDLSLLDQPFLPITAYEICRRAIISIAGDQQSVLQ